MHADAATILLLEDEPTVLDGMAHVLERAGYQAMTATDGQSALEQLRETTPDLILCDIMMPGMDGYEFFQTLRSAPDWELVPVVFVTAKDRPEDVRLGMRMGVDGYLTKPFEVEDLLGVVETRLQRMDSILEASQSEADQLRDRILSLLNHELRTPLTQIHGYVGLAELRGRELDFDALRVYLDGISAGAHRMTGLVENLLLAMEIETGRAAAAYDLRKYVVTVLPELVVRVVNSYEFQAGQAGIALVLSVPDSLPPVEADTKFLGRALGQLIDNAIKFSAAGDTVEVGAEAVGSTVVISVADQGRGIPSGELSNIFDLFYQVDRDYHEQQGAGLGLCIAKGLIALHGGQIKVESEEGKGSTFALMLPVAP